MKTKLFLILFLLAGSVYGQTSRAAHWYFGYQAGIDFSSGQPVTDTTGNLVSIEGSCSISDTLSNLFFYSSGETVWNRNGATMPNAPGLMGDQSSAQSSIVVPLPNNNSYYYLFTSISANNPNSGLRYNIIDMSLDGGLGDINSSKNILLYNSGTEELASTMSCNGKDYWILGRQSVVNKLKFYSYLLSSNGLATPIISQFNFTSPWWNAVGGLTFSQDGKTLCFSSFGTAIYIFDFDTQTGELTFRDSISHNTNEYVYSNAISPDSKKLYISSWTAGGYSMLSQFDLSASNITGTRVNLDSVDYSYGSPNGYGFIGQVRLAPDQRIYVCRWNQDHPFQTNPDFIYSLDSIDVINDPNLSGYSCNFQKDFLYLNHKPTQLGLPSFVSNFTSPVISKYYCQTGIISNSSERTDLEIYPNPYSIETTLKINENFKNITLSIYNTLGQSIKEVSNIPGQEIKLERGNLPAGVYFIRLVQDNKTIAANKIIIVD